MLDRSYAIADDVIPDSEHRRVRTIEKPIGMPSTCIALAENHSTSATRTLNRNATADDSTLGVEAAPIFFTSTPPPEPLSPSGQTSHVQCPSACSKDSLFNHPPEIADAPEISIPDNVDLVESSTAAAAKLVKVSEVMDNSPLRRNQSIANAHGTSINETVEATTASAIDSERPIEIKDSSTSIITDPLPTIASTAGTASIASLLLQPFPVASNSNSVYHMTKGPASSSNEEFKLQKAEPTILLADTQSTAVLTAVETTGALTAAASNDINGVYNKKIQPSIFESLADDLNKNDSAEVAPMLTAPAVIPADTDCFPVRIMARADSFNFTFGSDDICPRSDGAGHAFNFTYNIPVSEYMKENRFDLIFA